MVYYDWNIDNFGFIWSGFLHKYEGETADQAVPYNRVDVENFPEVATDQKISDGVYFNEDAKVIEDLSFDDKVAAGFLGADYNQKHFFATANLFADNQNDYRLMSVKIMPTHQDGVCEFVESPDSSQDYFLFTNDGLPIFGNGLTETEIQNVYKFFKFILENKDYCASRGLNVMSCLYLADDDWFSQKFHTETGLSFVHDIQSIPFFGTSTASTRHSLNHLTYSDGHFGFNGNALKMYRSNQYEVTNPVLFIGDTGFIRLLPQRELKTATYNLQPLARLATTVLPNDQPIAIHYTIVAVQYEKVDYDKITLIDMQGGVPVAYHYNVQVSKVSSENLFVLGFGEEYAEPAEVVDADKALDNALNDPTRVWRTPTEYYSLGNSTANLPAGDNAYIRADAYESSETEARPTWFWLNTLANWCTFKKTSPVTTELFVWNGMNGWDRFGEIMSDEEKAQTKYFYDLSRFTKGTKITSAIVETSSIYTYSSLKLTKDTHFSHYDEKSFQTIRINKKNQDDYSSDRYLYSVGMPNIMRLASGELEVLYILTVPGASSTDEVIQNDNIPFINAVCLAYFGDGSEKTIKDDWKRFFKVTDEEAGEVVTDDDATLYDADEINTIKVEEELSISLTVPRQYTETGLILGGDFVERWE